jgi:feruloyl esterase
VAVSITAFSPPVPQEALARVTTVRILCSVAVKAFLEEIRPQWEQRIGGPIDAQFDTAAGIKRRIDGGQAFDLVILPAELTHQLVAEGKVSGDSRALVARVGIGIGIWKSATKPDISTPEALRRVLLRAKSITYPENGASRAGIERMFERLGIASAIEPKVVFESGKGGLEKSVAEGKVELLITLISEILPAQRLDLVGPLPPEVQEYTDFDVGVGTHSASVDAERDLIELVSDPKMSRVFLHNGLEPPANHSSSHDAQEVIKAATRVAPDDRASRTESPDEQACRDLRDMTDLTITRAELKDVKGSTPSYCYVRGTIPPAIQYHVQLPLPKNWNGRFLMWGDGGTDGILNFADDRLSEGYAVANSNTGHDAGSEPGYTFAHDNLQARIDFGYRAVHVTATAAKTVMRAYYGKSAGHSYFEGCSLGGREGMMEAQRYPEDFDGIVVGSPAIFNQVLFATRIALYQELFRDNFAANLAFDTKGSGTPNSLTKLNILRAAVLEKCDAIDGIKDGVIDNPLLCHFSPDVDLKEKMCPGNVNADDCFTTAQLQTIKDIYNGSRDSKGRPISKGRALGSEFGWSRHLIPYEGNALLPSGLLLAADRLNYFFYKTDPPPGYSWTSFNIDDVTAGLGDFVSSIIDAKDPNLTGFLINRRGKLIMYHGWGDALVPPEPTVDYYKDVVATTFGGDLQKATRQIRLFMAPGMDHCKGGPGPDTWDKLAPLVDWVEAEKPPNFLVATHSTAGKVDNERRICPYPQQAVYVGPPNGQNDRANWVQANFICRDNQNLH